MEIAVQRMKARITAQTRCRRRNRVFIPVNAVQRRRTVRGRQNRAAVSASAQRAVRIDAALPDIHPLQHLLQQNRLMHKSHGAPPDLKAPSGRKSPKDFIYYSTGLLPRQSQFCADSARQIQRSRHQHNALRTNLLLCQLHSLVDSRRVLRGLA